VLHLCAELKAFITWYIALVKVSPPASHSLSLSLQIHLWTSAETAPGKMQAWNIDCSYKAASKEVCTCICVSVKRKWWEDSSGREWEGGGRSEWAERAGGW